MHLVNRMSLVAYGNSDSEEGFEDQDEAVSSSSSAIQTAQKENEERAAEESVSSSSVSVPMKQRETVKITIPSLEQFKDEDTFPEPPKKPAYKSGSGLFSILPPPKYSSSVTQNFKPHILTKKKDTRHLPPTLSKKGVNQGRTFEDLLSEYDLDSANNAPVSRESREDVGYLPEQNFDLYALIDSPIGGSESRDVPADEPCGQSILFSSLPEPVQSSSAYIPPGHSFLTRYEEASIRYVDETEQHYSPVNEAGNENSFLNDKEFIKMTGKREKEEINLIDVSGADQLTGKNEWLMQSLTEEKIERPSKRKHGMPTQQQKRKHQITYLAFQAKERELDLKNQWAMNSLTRRETQAKYGF